MSTWNLPPGVTTNDEHINPRGERFKAGAKMGRLADGAQRDHGRVIHALPQSIGHFGYGRALCGTEPGGRRSMGWATDYRIEQINCSRCMKIMERRS